MNLPGRFVLMMCFIGLSACQSAREHRSWRQIYISEFKLTYFETLLQKAFHHPQFKKATAADRSHFSEPILTESSRALIELYTTQDAARIKQDSIQSIGQRAEGAQGKQVWRFALERYHSKWLDRLAKGEVGRFMILMKQ